jgi:hypothetical protein
VLEDLLVEELGGGDLLAGQEAVEQPLPRLAPEPVPPTRVAQQEQCGGGQSVGIGGRDQAAGDVVEDRLRGAPEPGRQDGAGRGHRLEHARLRIRGGPGDDHEVGLPDRGAGALAGEAHHRVVEAERPGAVPERPPRHPGVEQEETRLGDRLADPHERGDEDGHPGARERAADPGEERRVRREAEVAADVGVARARTEGLDVDPAPDDPDAVDGQGSETGIPAPHLVGHGDDAGGRPGGQRPEAPER